RRPDPRELANAARGLENRRPRAGELERIAIRCDHNGVATTLLLVRDCCREKVVALVARTFGGREAERPDELRQQVELLDQLVVEHPPALMPGEELVPVRRSEERVPADERGARPFGLPKAHEEVRESDERMA